MIIPLVNSRCEMEPMISLTAAMSALVVRGVALGLDGDAPADERCLIDRDQVDASVSSRAGAADLVEFRDRLAELDKELFELVPARSQHAEPAR